VESIAPNKTDPLTISKGNKMPLKEILDSLTAGHAIRRSTWPEGIQVRLVDYRVMIRNEDKLYHPWIMGSEDLVADDWQVI